MNLFVSAFLLLLIPLLFYIIAKVSKKESDLNINLKSFENNVVVPIQLSNVGSEIIFNEK